MYQVFYVFFKYLNSFDYKKWQYKCYSKYIILQEEQTLIHYAGNCAMTL